MVISPFRKNKIILSDYQYEDDIKYRLILSHIDNFEIEVVREILHGSLKTRISTLAEYLAVDEKLFLETLEKLLILNLFTIENGHIIVAKEKRKYYESEIERFDERFRPDLEFFRSLLNKVSIHFLPIWYSIPRTSDDIFSSIIEKYLQTPRIYQRYMDDLSFEDPNLNQIMQDLFSAKDYTLKTCDLQKKYSLSEEKLEEYLLLLEFNLVCLVGYKKSKSGLERIITPFHEWHTLLKFVLENAPKPISEPLKVKRIHKSDFGFIQDLTKILEEALKKPLKLQKVDDKYTISDRIAKQILPHISTITDHHHYVFEIIDKLQKLQLVTVSDNILKPRNIADAWLEKHLQEQAIAIYRYGSPKDKAMPGGYINRDLRELEKCLKRFSDIGWIYFDDFTKACLAPIRDHQPVTLIKMGRRWKYRLPEYGSKDFDALYQFIFVNLFQAGIIASGTHKGKPCFTVTPFGRMTLE